MEVTTSEEPIRPRSILFVITKAVWGGAQRYVYDLALAAREHGYLVTVACGTPGELTERLSKEGITVLEIPGLARDIRLSNEFRAFKELFHLLRDLRPDIVHANSSKAGFIATCAARGARVPRIVFTAHGWAWNEMRPLKEKLVFAFFHLLTVWCSHTVICVSSAIRRDARWMPFSRSRFTVIRHGVAPLAPFPRADARRKLEDLIGRSLPENALWIGSMAELHPTKGLDTLVRAFALVADEIPEAVLVLIGAGQDAGRLNALTHMLELRDRVHFVGHVENGGRYVSAFDLFALPSRSEALGYALLEAGIAGLPVVASEVGGIPEIIVGGETGLLTPPDNDAALAEALRTLVRNRELGVRLAGALRERVMIEFSKENMVAKTFALYTH